MSRICKHWLRGNCTYQNCKFLHVAMEERRKYDVPCKYYLRGYCKNGQNCRYRHNSEKRNEKRRKLDTKFKTAHCTFYLGGYCKKQENCIYIHDPIKLREVRDERNHQKLQNVKKGGLKSENEQRKLLILDKQKVDGDAHSRVKNQVVNSTKSSVNDPR